MGVRGRVVALIAGSETQTTAQLCDGSQSRRSGSVRRSNDRCAIGLVRTSAEHWRGVVLRAVVLARERPRSSLDIGRRLALRSLAVQARNVVTDAQSAEPVQS